MRVQRHREGGGEGEREGKREGERGRGREGGGEGGDNKLCTMVQQWYSNLQIPYCMQCYPLWWEVAGWSG